MTTAKLLLLCLTFFGLLTGAADAAVTCDISTSGAAFGSYDSIGSQDRDTSGTITVTCSGTTGDSVTYTISLSPGAGSFSNRNLSAGTSVLNYNLYTDISRSQVWGDGSAGTAVLSDSYTLNVSPTTHNYTVYGRVPKSQNQALSGSYSDNLTVALVY